MSRLVTQIIIDAKNLDIGDPRANEELRKVKGFDSLAFVQLIFEIEKIIQEEIPANEIEKLVTLGDLANFLKSRDFP